MSSPAWLQKPIGAGAGVPGSGALSAAASWAAPLDAAGVPRIWLSAMAARPARSASPDPRVASCPASEFREGGANGASGDAAGRDGSSLLTNPVTRRHAPSKAPGRVSRPHPSRVCLGAGWGQRLRRGVLSGLGAGRIGHQLTQRPPRRQMHLPLSTPADAFLCPQAWPCRKRPWTRHAGPSVLSSLYGRTSLYRGSTRQRNGYGRYTLSHRKPGHVARWRAACDGARLALWWSFCPGALRHAGIRSGVTAAAASVSRARSRVSSLTWAEWF